MNTHPAIRSMSGGQVSMAPLTPEQIDYALLHVPAGGSVTYYRGNLAEACGIALDKAATREELEARATRAAAWEAHEDGRAILTQRRVARDVCDYIITVRA